ncbi:hypothetical protein HQ560_12555 [bacterium]|nr:hypothetical protein [bacterium]
MPRPRTLALLLVLPLVAGCGWLFGNTGRTDVTVPIDNETLLILPFSMPARSYFQSSFGSTFALDVQKAVTSACKSANILGPDEIPQSLKDHGAQTMKPGELLDRESIVHVGLQLKARYVLVGEIHEIRGKKPKTFGVLQGMIKLSARIVDTKEQKVAWRADRATFMYPKNALGGEEMFADEKDLEVVLRKTMLEAAVGLTEPFIGRERTLQEDVSKALH